MHALSRSAGIAGLLAAILATLVVGPVAAADGSRVEPGQPDSSIRFRQYRSPFGVHLAATPWTGLDVRNLTAYRQTERLHAMGAYERDTWLVFVVAIENEGGADRFRIDADGTGGWPVKYFSRGTDITAAVVDGTYRTAKLSNSERAFIRVKVRLGSSGSGVMRQLTVSSLAHPHQRDVVRLRVDYSACSC